MNWKIEIVYNNTYYEVNPERIVQDERLDEALDSVKFCFISNVLTTDIPPFTKAVITNNSGVITYYYCSTTCDEIVEMPGYYYHTATLVEATKVLETFVIGTKAFSVVSGKSNYNQGKHRLAILNNIVYRDYGVTINLSNYLNSTLTDIRAYSFGAGTTYFDIALEICKVQNCLPVVTYISDNGKTITLDIQSLNLESAIIQKTFSIFTKVTKNQSVDEYCSDVVTEMDSVVDRNNLTTCVITPRSTSDTIYKDNALLRLPTNVESVENLYAWMEGFTGPTCKIPAYMLDFGGNASYDNDRIGTVSLIQWIESYSANGYVETLLKNWVETMESETGYSPNYYDEGTIYWQKDDYCLLLLWNANDYDNFHKEGWTSIGLLNKDQWSLLTTDEQPAYIYYDTDTNVIDGFRNYKDADFWNSMIWGDKGPFLKEFYKNGTDANYQRTLKYVDFDDKAEDMSYTEYTITYIVDYHLYYYGNSSPTDDILEYKWKVEYYAKPHIGANESKSIQPENESAWKKSTRSYNNGANTVDFNQLIPAMKKSANMLGLEITTVESLQDFEVGIRTNLGYIVSKQTDFNIIDGTKVINNAVYNCCENYQQIAQAIGIDTQYEATNVPSTGIVTRYITIKKEVNANVFNQIEDDNSVLYLVLINSDNEPLSKACAKLVYADTIYLICEMEDNFAFDYAKTDSNTIDYYKREPVPYADENQCIGSASVNLYIDYISDNATISDYDALPRGVFGSQMFNFDNIYIGKDSRERLIFQYKITKS